MYKVAYTKSARKTLDKMDVATSGTIVSWVRKNLEGTDNPRRSGKALTGHLAGLWRYRVGDLRIIADIKDERLIILLVEIRNRRTAYR